MTRKKRLREYDPFEVSLIARPANFKKFLIHKQAKGAHVAPESDTISLIKRLPQGVLDSIDALASKLLLEKDAEGQQVQLSEGAQAALKAIGRIMAPYRDELRDAHMDAIQEAVGVGGSQVHPAATPDGMADDDQEDEQEEDDEDGEETEDNDAADDAPGPDAGDAKGDSGRTDSTRSKGGDIVAQAMGNKPTDVSDAAYDAALKAAKAAFASSLKTAVNKSARDVEPAPVQPKKEDKMANEAEDKTAKEAINKEAYDALTRELESIKASHKELVEKSVARDKELATQREAALAREYAERAAQYESVGDKAKIAAILKSAHGDKEAQENLEAILKSAVEKTRATKDYAGDLYGEVGTKQPANRNVGSSENEMQALVSKRIEKSADSGMTKEQLFVDTVKNTPEGRALYERMTREGV